MARKKKENNEIVEDVFDSSNNKPQNEQSNEVIDEDLYAPFGDKTFSKDSSNDEEIKQEETDQEKSAEVIQDEQHDINNLQDNNNSETDEKHTINLQIQKRPEKSYDEQNEFDIKLLKTYIGKHIESIFMKKFNICAFLFQGLYLIYRGVYSLGLIMFTITSALVLFFIDNYIALIIIGIFYILSGIVLGLKFNKEYLDRCFNKIKNIQEKNEYFSDDQLISSCKEDGDTSMGVVVVAVLVIVGMLYIVISAIKGNDILPDDGKTDENEQITEVENNNISNDTNLGDNYQYQLNDNQNQVNNTQNQVSNDNIVSDQNLLTN